MNKLDTDYQLLLKDILDSGVLKKDRTGTGTLSIFGRQIRHKMKTGFPLLTTKKMAWKQIVTELLWFLKGDTNIKYLLDNNCHIWDGDCYKNYLNKVSDNKSIYHSYMLKHDDDSFSPYPKDEFIEKVKTDSYFRFLFGNLGNIYGKQWRNWGRIDQINNLIKEIKENPDSRRLMVSAWNVEELGSMTLPPCHYSFQIYTRPLDKHERYNLLSEDEKKTFHAIVDANMRKNSYYNFEHTLDNKYPNLPERSISLMFNMRSNDVPLGLPFNIASYGLLLTIIGRIVNMQPDEIICNIGDAHIYSNQIEQIKEQIERQPYYLPDLDISDSIDFGGIDAFLNSCKKEDFKLVGYKSHPSIKIPLSN